MSGSRLFYPLCLSLLFLSLGPDLDEAQELRGKNGAEVR